MARGDVGLNPSTTTDAPIIESGLALGQVDLLGLGKQSSMEEQRTRLKLGPRCFFKRSILPLHFESLETR